MYSYQERVKAVKLLIKYGMSYATTMRELGYPSSRTTLRKWCLEYSNHGKLRKRYKRSSRYSLADKKRAINHYLETGKNASYTIRCLGYPCRQILSEWLDELAPNERKLNNFTGQKKVYSNEEKSEIISKLLMRNKPITVVSEDNKVSRSTLYNWQKQILPSEVLEKMRKNKKQKPNEIQSFADLEKEHQNLLEEYNQLKKQLEHLELEKDILTEVVKVIKKDKGINLSTIRLSNREKAIVINALRDKYSLSVLLKELKMAKSSYFYQQSVLDKKDKYENYRQQIEKIFADSFNTYGYRRIHASLKNMGITLSEKIIRRLMKEEGQVVVRKKRAKYNAYKGESLPVADNLLKRDFNAEKPNEKWVTDITEFAIPAGKIYLSPIVDCFDGMPVSWSIGTNPTAKLANTMLKNAVLTLEENEKPIIHSDRGGHYRWAEWIRLTENAGLIRSMSRKASPQDNSACEGFFGLIKNEMFYGRKWNGISTQEFIDTLDFYLNWFVNDRIKIGLGGLSPLQYRKSIGANI